MTFALLEDIVINSEVPGNTILEGKTEIEHMIHLLVTSLSYKVFKSLIMLVLHNIERWQVF